MVIISVRDINGKRFKIFKEWDEISNFITTHMDEIEDLEILLITYKGTCIYSELGNEPITWEEVRGFFA